MYNEPYAFTDGSFDSTTGIFGYGGFLVSGGREYILQGSSDDPELAASWNVAGETFGAIAAIKKARELYYKVKLDTNGTLPDELEVFLNDKELRPDFVAMDYKTSPARYASTMCPAFSSLFGNTEFFEKKVLKCIELVSSLPQQEREWRTVMVPGLITKEDLKIMASYLPQDASWQFAQFMNGNCIDPAYNTLTPYTDDELKELITYAKTLITGAELR